MLGERAELLTQMRDKLRLQNLKHFSLHIIKGLFNKILHGISFNRTLNQRISYHTPFIGRFAVSILPATKFSLAISIKSTYIHVEKKNRNK